MKTISKEELKKKIDNKENFKLVMVLNEWAFNAMRIPGSINISFEAEAKKLLNPQEEIVVYCSNESCSASRIATEIMEKKGFKNVYRYVGGLDEWKAAGYPLEGDRVN